MKKKLFRLTIAALAVAVSGGVATAMPAQATTTPAAASDPDLPAGLPSKIADYDAADNIALVRASDLPVDSKKGLTDLFDRLGDDGLQRIRRIKQDLGLDPATMQSALQAAIDPDDYACTAYDSLSFWRVEQLARFQDLPTAINLDQLGVFDLSMVDAMLTQGSRQDSFPAGTEPTTRSAFRKAKAFWGQPTTPVHLAGVDTSVWRPAARERWISAIAYLLDLPDDTPQERDDVWTQVRPFFDDLFAAEPSTRGGLAPLFASGISAYDPAREGDRDPILGKKRTLLVGTGYYRAMQSADFDRISMKAAVAKGYSEFVQVDGAVIDDTGTPESGRRNGLLGDAMSGYFLQHRRGLNITKAQRRSVLGHAPGLGDCSFGFSSHEGTPNQATKAMRWGMSRPPGPISAPPAFAQAFDAVLPRIIRPDAGRIGNQDGEK